MIKKSKKCAWTKAGVRTLKALARKKKSRASPSNVQKVRRDKRHLASDCRSSPVFEQQNGCIEDLTWINGRFLFFLYAFFWRNCAKATPKIPFELLLGA